MTSAIAKVRKVRLGWEDHGIFTCMLDLDFGGSGQGAGGYALDAPVKVNGVFAGRAGTVYGMNWIMRVMEAVDARDWSEVEGRTVLAVRESDDWGAKVIGIKPLPTEKGRPFMFADLEWKE